MPAIRISRPRQRWKPSPATLLPADLLFRLFRPQSTFTVVLDDHPVGEIGRKEARTFDVEPGDHRLHVRFLGLRRSDELGVSLEEGEERQFICGTSGMGWPTLREASPGEVTQL
jgi:hypothetical protein